MDASGRFARAPWARTLSDVDDRWPPRTARLHLRTSARLALAGTKVGPRRRSRRTAVRRRTLAGSGGAVPIRSEGLTSTGTSLRGDDASLSLSGTPCGLRGDARRADRWLLERQTDARRVDGRTPQPRRCISLIDGHTSWPADGRASR